MDKNQLTLEAEYFEYIKTFQFIEQNGRLDLEAFCINLSTCFGCDRVTSITPQPRAMYNLLIDAVYVSC